MIQFDEHIFQMGWFNHQLDTHRFNIFPYLQKGHSKASFRMAALSLRSSTQAGEPALWHPTPVAPPFIDIFNEEGTKRIIQV